MDSKDNVSLFLHVYVFNHVSQRTDSVLGFFFQQLISTTIAPFSVVFASANSCFLFFSVRATQ